MMRNFYDDYEDVKNGMVESGEIEKDEGVDFSFMDNYLVLDDKEQECKIPWSTFNLSLGDFLHGFCDLFAKRLHDEFGYRVENLYDSEGGLIHSYCRTDDGRYVDVRGVTSDGEAFFEEFADWLDPQYPYMCDMNHDVASLDDADSEKLYEYTKYILRDYHIYGAA